MILRKWLNFIKIYRHPIVLIPDLFVLKSLRLKFSRTGAEPNCPTTMHFRIFRRAFARKISI